MSREIPERDWKVLRELKPIALDRFCQRVILETNALCADTGQGSHQRYLAIWQLLKKRDAQIAEAFDDMSRSQAWRHITVMRHFGLLTDDEFSRFTQETRASAQRQLDILETPSPPRGKRSEGG